MRRKIALRILEKTPKGTKIMVSLYASDLIRRKRLLKNGNNHL